MKKSQVFFIAVKDGEDIQKINAKLKTLLNEINPFQNISEEASVAVKLHFGEEGNVGYVNPIYITTIVKELKQRKVKVFLTDTNTLYKGSRTNAIEHLNLAYRHGFSPDKVEAPVVIADGLKGDDYEEVKIKGSFIKTAYIATGINNAEAIVVVSHFKGHLMTGFGGAIKNLGMGCASRKGKLVQHGGISPFVKEEKCSACGKCIEVCLVSAIQMVNSVRKIFSNGVNNKAIIDPKICIGCAGCIAICPVEAIDVEWEKGADTIQEKMVEYALAAIDNKRDKCVYFNFAIKITKECDCLAKDDPKICPDIGIFVSFDPASIDQACADKINRIAGRDLLKEQHPQRDWRKQLQHAHNIGLGSCDYELVEIK